MRKGARTREATSSGADAPPYVGLPARPTLKTSPRAGFPGASAPLKWKVYEDAIRVGKVLCKVHGMNQMEAVMINEDGDEIDRITVFR